MSHCNEITDTGLEHVAGLTKLTSLELAHCKDATGTGLGQVPQPAQLSSLNLSCCASDPESAGALPARGIEAANALESTEAQPARALGQPMTQRVQTHCPSGIEAATDLGSAEALPVALRQPLAWRVHRLPARGAEAANGPRSAEALPPKGIEAANAWGGG